MTAMFKGLRDFWNSIPREVRFMSWATAIRWAGWGMLEPLTGVFLFSLLHNYGLSAVIDSLAGIVFVLIVPMAGALADRISLKTFLVGGLFFFFFGGLWSASAATSLVIFAAIANVLCGIALASDVVGRATYIRRYVPQETVATVMGFQNTFLNIGTIAGSLVTLALIPFLPLPWIFFGVVPTNLVTLLLFARLLRTDKAAKGRSGLAKEYSPESYWEVWRGSMGRKSGLLLLAGLMFFLYALFAFCTILIPIYAYTNGAGYGEVIVLYIIAILPEIFSSPLGKLADRSPGRVLSLGLLGAAAVIAWLTLLHSYFFVLGAVLALEVIFVLLTLAVEHLVTARAEPNRYGRVSSVFEGLKEMGKFAGAIGLGFAMDGFGSVIVFPALALIAILFAVLSGKKFLPAI